MMPAIANSLTTIREVPGSYWLEGTAKANT